MLCTEFPCEWNETGDEAYLEKLYDFLAPAREEELFIGIQVQELTSEEVPVNRSTTEKRNHSLCKTKSNTFYYLLGI
jgi:hypothetical protein